MTPSFFSDDMDPAIRASLHRILDGIGDDIPPMAPPTPTGEEGADVVQRLIRQRLSSDLHHCFIAALEEWCDHYKLDAMELRFKGSDSHLNLYAVASRIAENALLFTAELELADADTDQDSRG